MSISQFSNLLIFKFANFLISQPSQPSQPSHYFRYKMSEG
ncbi:hypothetical protein HMPREF9074_07365 [Capnocytophaga sp. oral taxon 329 str. F0087]|nr:hypothetical protein HMPREF9074_07365 [Capnocytophaga sp. oral taxon 329 str. F0087]